MSDYISRKAALGCLYNTLESYYVKRNIMDLPAADVRSVTLGRWVWDPDGLDWGLGCWVCNQCLSRNANIPAQKNMKPLDWAGSKFCPNCGADMREGRVKDE